MDFPEGAKVVAGAGQVPASKPDDAIETTFLFAIANRFDGNSRRFMG